MKIVPEVAALVPEMKAWRSRRRSFCAGRSHDFNDDALAVGACYWVTLAEQQLAAEAGRKAA